MDKETQKQSVRARQTETELYSIKLPPLSLPNQSSFVLLWLTKGFRAVLDCFHQTQYVNFITHTSGHILDLGCFSSITSYNISSAELPVSDHKAVLFNTNLPLSKSKVHRTMSYRNIRHVNPEDLISVITSNPVPAPTPSLPDLVAYDSDTFDHTPLQKCSLNS